MLVLEPPFTKEKVSLKLKSFGSNFEDLFLPKAQKKYLCVLKDNLDLRKIKIDSLSLCAQKSRTCFTRQRMLHIRTILIYEVALEILKKLSCLRPGHLNAKDHCTALQFTKEGGTKVLPQGL